MPINKRNPKTPQTETADTIPESADKALNHSQEIVQRYENYLRYLYLFHAEMLSRNPETVEYHRGMMAACFEIYQQVTGEKLFNPVDSVMDESGIPWMLF